jgi:hypothetical protein
MTVNQIERPLTVETEARKNVLARLMRGSPLALSEARSRIDELRALIAAGHVSLRVVQYEWGLDFELVAEGDDIAAVVPKR